MAKNLVTYKDIMGKKEAIEEASTFLVLCQTYGICYYMAGWVEV